MQAVWKDPNPDKMGGHSLMTRLVLDGEDFISAMV